VPSQHLSTVLHFVCEFIPLSGRSGIGPEHGVKKLRESAPCVLLYVSRNVAGRHGIQAYDHSWIQFQK
ncbi:MAG TPA: hypothetical protein PKX87_08220, partial [Alphaproteobacteria bacterium]|nr:hypothetical protein [Alphaproteobacteria bacterium]